VRRAVLLILSILKSCTCMIHLTTNDPWYSSASGLDNNIGIEKHNDSSFMESWVMEPASS